MLAAAAYGERWGRHWLDLAGYADSEGILDADYVRSAAWRYRDWVIRALNADMPYDRFLREQIAGDETATTGRLRDREGTARRRWSMRWWRRGFCAAPRTPAGPTSSTSRTRRGTTTRRSTTRMAIVATATWA